MPLEVQLAFMEFLAFRMDFRTFMTISDRTRMDEISELKRIIVLYTILLTDLLIRLRRHSHVTILVEENEQLEPHIDELLKKSMARAKRKSFAEIRSHVTIDMTPKMAPISLSVIDFYMYVVQAWWVKGAHRNYEQQEYRNLALLEPSVSLLRSFETGVISNRAMRVTS